MHWYVLPKTCNHSSCVQLTLTFFTILQILKLQCAIRTTVQMQMNDFTIQNSTTELDTFSTSTNNIIVDNKILTSDVDLGLMVGSVAVGVVGIILLSVVIILTLALARKYKRDLRERETIGMAEDRKADIGVPLKDN